MKKLLLMVVVIAAIASTALGQNQWTVFRLSPTTTSLPSGDGWMKINSSTNKWNVRINGVVENVATESYVGTALGAYWPLNTSGTNLTGDVFIEGSGSNYSFYLGTTTRLNDIALYASDDIDLRSSDLIGNVVNGGRFTFRVNTNSTTTGPAATQVGKFNILGPAFGDQVELAAENASTLYLRYVSTGTTLTEIKEDADEISFFTAGSTSMSFTGARLTMGSDNKLVFNNATDTRKIILQEGANNDHQLYGFGTTGAGGSLDYHISNPGGAHKFFAGTSSSTSTELFTIVGDGRIQIGVTPTTNNSATSALVFDGGEIKIRDVSTIGGTDFWPLGSTATQTANVTIHSGGFDFTWDGAGTFITDAANGVDLNYSLTGFGLLIDPFGDINLGSPDALVVVNTASQIVGISAGASTTVVSPYNAISTKPFSEPADPFAYAFTYDDLGGIINAQLGYLNPTTSLNNSAYVDETDAYFVIDAGGTPMKVGVNAAAGVYLDAITAGLPATVQGETSLITSTTMSSITRAPAGTNSVEVVLTLERVPGSGTAGSTGIGTAVNFDFNNGSSINKQGASLTMTTADVTNASEDSHFTIKTMFAGTLTDRLKLENDGDVILSNGDVTWNAGLGNGGFQWSGNTIELYDDGGDTQLTATGHITFSAAGTSKNVAVNSSTGNFTVTAGGTNIQLVHSAAGSGNRITIDGSGMVLSAQGAGDDIDLSSVDQIRFYNNGVNNFSIETDGSWNLNGSNGTSGQFLMTNGGSSTPTWESLPTYSSGSYTPTVSSEGGVVTSTTAAECFYLRIGSVVHVEGFISVTTSGAGIASFHINLPVASNFSNQAKGPGLVTVFGGGTARGYGQVESDGTTDDLLVYYTAVGATSDALKFSCTYLIQ